MATKGEKNLSRGEKEPRHRRCTRGSSSGPPVLSVQRPDGCRASDGQCPNCGVTPAELDQGGVVSQLLRVYMRPSHPEFLPSTPHTHPCLTRLSSPSKQQQAPGQEIPGAPAHEDRVGGGDGACARPGHSADLGWRPAGRAAGHHVLHRQDRQVTAPLLMREPPWCGEWDEGCGPGGGPSLVLRCTVQSRTLPTSPTSLESQAELSEGQLGLREADTQGSGEPGSGDPRP